MTKRQQAQQIFDTHPTKDRKSIIQCFIDQLNMSKAGASTYYYMVCGNEPKQTASTTTPDNDGVDNRPLYSACTFVGDMITDIAAFFNIEDALKLKKDNTIIVKGCPDDDATVHQLIAIN